MQKRFFMMAILFLSLIPMMYCEHGISEGRENVNTTVVGSVPQSDIENIQVEQSDRAKIQQETENVAVAGQKSTPAGSASSPQALPQDNAQIKPYVKATGSEATVATPSPTIAVSETKADARQIEMLTYINAERAELGLDPLVLAKNLSEGAGVKSQDLAVNGYFNHYSPTYGSPFEMMNALGIKYGTAGENIAKNFSVKSAHEAFMNSPGHKANIENPEFNKIGLGFYQTQKFLYVTQWFTD